MKSFAKIGGRALACILVCMAVVSCGYTSTDWRATLDAELPMFGHRNWIVVADSAYPKQSASGIETIYTGEDQLDVLKTVLREIKATTHVKAIVLLDAELENVIEEDAPGIEAYKRHLKELLKDKEVNVMAHEDIIGKLDTSAKLYNILVLKTDMVVPYTSVFVELDCAYWDIEKEKKLRDVMNEKGSRAE